MELVYHNRNTERKTQESDLKEREYLRVKLYEMTAKLVRAFTNLSPDIE